MKKQSNVLFEIAEELREMHEKLSEVQYGHKCWYTPAKRIHLKSYDNGVLVIKYFKRRTWRRVLLVQLLWW